LRIGLKTPDVETGRTPRKEAVSRIGELFDGAGIDYKISNHIESDIWKKYILNCAYNVATAHYNNTIGELRSDPVKAKEYESLVWEAWRVADAKGVAVTRMDAEAIIKRFYEELADDATSSLQRDLWQGKPVEIETVSGYLVKEAARLGVEVPISSRMYEGLKKIASVMRTYAGV
ncbi:MAG: 2-dehydropantoate 2-reductase, partial [Lachnospiraceae bacterium]|nr:2-dehydropantoate 2-reductase [Lachnospiraceae bacterium]